jgi:hypothetical protein
MTSKDFKIQLISKSTPTLLLPAIFSAISFDDLAHQIKIKYDKRFEQDDKVSFCYCETGDVIEQTHGRFNSVNIQRDIVCLNVTLGESYRANRPTPQPVPDDVLNFFNMLASTKCTEEYVDGFAEPQSLIRFVSNDQPAYTVPFGKGSSIRGIFIRSEYVTLCREIIEANEGKNDIGEENKARFLQIGNPGIGKTFFGFYLMKQLIDKKKRFFYEPNEPIGGSYRVIFFDPDAHDNYVEFKRSDLERSPLHDIYIVDGHSPTDMHSKTVLLVSPRKGHYAEFEKCQSVRRQFMHLWTLDELEKCRQLLFSQLSKPKMENIFEKWGGFARYALELALDETAQNTVDAQFKAAIANCSSNIKHYLQKQTRLIYDDELSHRIILITSFAPNSENEYEYNFSVTKHAAELIIQHLKSIITFAGCFEIIRYATTFKDISDVFGHLYEPLCHQVLANGGTFVIHELGGDVKNEEEIELPKLLVYGMPKVKKDSQKEEIKTIDNVINSIVTNLSKKSSHITCPDKFGTFDGFAYCNFGAHGRTYQITCSSDHSNNTTMESEAVVLSLLNNENHHESFDNNDNSIKKIRQYLVVPPDAFEILRKNNVQKVFDGPGK